MILYCGIHGEKKKSQEPNMNRGITDIRQSAIFPTPKRIRLLAGLSAWKAGNLEVV